MELKQQIKHQQMNQFRDFRPIYFNNLWFMWIQTKCYSTSLQRSVSVSFYRITQLIRRESLLLLGLIKFRRFACLPLRHIIFFHLEKG